ncbi:(-)-germacrene D synthase-like isoform X1 [Momordica charantia]|uniref:(-)-germacrene D synthase-like isoform X1 n=1 Tax=Momordica charantia TaxID=3673 RepID=A0A6J1CQI9_MOMCH|nr:(-)-germacrene D synthase-like isoform X1 [Momordica charantia]
MSSEVVSDLIAPNNGSSNDSVLRRSANFEPSLWGDYFLSYPINTVLDDMVRKQLEEQREEVRRMLEAAEKCSEKLSLIDSIQRLGLSYHFEGEINEILEHMQNDSCNLDDDEDIYIVALRFRLLRQQGYSVSCEIFNRFTNENGDFKESMVKDQRGILSLYQASHLGMNGENILDKALAFTTTHLQAIAMDASSPFAEEAKYSLKWPIYKAVPRFTARNHISLYDKDPLKNNVLLSFAKLDFNALQKLYKKELAEVSRWLKDQKLMENLSFARNRVVECYFWALGVFYEPKYSYARSILVKNIIFISFLDDMYDVYATLDELQLFTDAIERWDINAIDKLPHYMKFLYQAILDAYRDVEQDIDEDNNILSFGLDCAKAAMKRQCRVYLAEAKWFYEGYVPTMEEYMEIATISASYHLFAASSFLGMGDVVSKEVLEWAKSDPIMLSASGDIGRLMNDIVSHEFEQERGDVASAVECYMKQYGVSEEEAVVELEKQVIKAWKDVTEDYMKSNKFPNAILSCVINVNRLSDFFYKEEDGYTFPNGEIKRFITSMLKDPVPF